MHILFIDPIGWQYTIDAPYERPFGGSQSALAIWPSSSHDLDIR